MPVSSVFIKYKKPAFYDELLEVETRVEKLPELKIHLDHTVRSTERNVIICEGYVELVFINSNTKKVTRPPEIFMNVLKPFFNQDND
jgi:acyl-CoA thioester hydrolase